MIALLKRNCVILLCFAFAGCASITSGTSQSIRIEAMTKDGRLVTDAECRVQNDRGTSSVISGQQTLVDRSSNTFEVTCVSAELPPAVGVGTSRINGSMAGNILAGGIIGMVVDANNGAGYSYPSWIRLTFGEERAYDTRGTSDTEAALGTFVRETVKDSAVATPTTVAKAAPALRIGAALQYELTDSLTGTTKPVRYVVDGIEEGTVSFNNGGKVEDAEGRLRSMTAPIGGLFDESSPPEGWGRPGVKPGMRWKAAYVATTGDKVRHDLEANATEIKVFTINGKQIEATRIDYKGWVYIPSSSFPGAARTGSAFTATVFYANDLRRVVRFEGNLRPTGRAPIKEVLELVRVPG